MSNRNIGLGDDTVREGNSVLKQFISEARMAQTRVE